MKLTKTALDDMVARGCAHPGCDHRSHSEEMFLHGICHPGGRIEVGYRNGVIRVGCVECKRDIARIAVEYEDTGVNLGLGSSLLRLSQWMRERTGPSDGTEPMLTEATAALQTAGFALDQPIIPPQTVLIRVEGGLVQGVGCPPGVTVEVRDYDTDTEHTDGDTSIDSEDETCVVSQYSAQDGDTLDDWPTIEAES